MNYKYCAWVSNDQGATTDVTLPMSERRRSMRAWEDAARAEFGSGWTVHVMRIRLVQDGNEVLGEPEEV